MRGGTVAANTMRGAQVGFIMAVLLCAWVAVLTLIKGSPELRFRNGETVSAFRITALYLVACPTIGALVGMMRKLMRHLPIAVLTGIVLSIPLAFMLGYTIDSALPLDRDGLLTVAFFSLSFGIGGGLILHRLPRSR